MRPNISLCMIVKDEIENLKKNLSPLVESFSEVIVVDTGSKDGTRQYLNTLAPHVKIIDFEWIDNFSAARNEYLKAANCKWSYWMDADEYLDPSYVSILERCSKKGKKNTWIYQYQPGMTTFQIKLFANTEGIKYTMRCHEQIYPSLKKAGVMKLRQFPEPFKIDNPSYSETPQRSSVRNIKLLEKDISEQPDYLMSYIHLAYEYCNLGQYAKGIETVDTLLNDNSTIMTLQNRQAFSLAASAKKMIALQQKLHKKAEQGQSLTPKELKELIRLGSQR